MGKLKISKTKKNKNSRGSSGIPNWLLSTLVILVVLAVLITCASTFVASSGVVMRWSNAMTLNEYKVSGNMMAYFYQTSYMNFMNQYSSYISYFSIDPYSDLKKQEFAPEGSYDSAFLGEFEGTWFDYFMSQAKDSVQQLLIYAAEAENLGVELTEEDKVEIEASIDTLLINIQSSYGAGLSEDTYLSNVYGKGVKRGDIRKAMELSTLASKVAQKISDNIEASITDERVNSTYADNKNEFNLVDYFSYSFNVKYSDVVKEKFADKKATDLTDAEKAEVLVLYKEKIAAAHAAAEELAKKTSLDEFRNYVVEYEVKDLYDSEFDSATSKLTSEQKPSEADLATIKEKTIAAVVAEVNGGKTEVTKDVAADDSTGTLVYTVYGITITADFSTAAETFKANLFKKALAAREDNLMEKVNYIAPDKDGNKDAFSEWAFDANRIVDDTKNIEEGDGANGAEVKVSDESFSAEVSIIVRPTYRDETLSRNVAYMLFTKADAAQKAIDAIAATQGLDKDKFLAIANDSATKAEASTYLEDCIIGTMQSEEFDEWLYNALAGSYTTEPIEMSDGSLMVAYFVCEGKIAAWENTVKAYIYNTDYTKYETDMTDKFTSSVVINDKVIAKVGD